jgi:uncharacterized protein (TIGR03083 family)
MLEYGEYLVAIEREAAALASAAHGASPDTPVPTCPGWALRDLLIHLGRVQIWARTMVETRARERLAWSELAPLPGDDAGAEEVARWLGDAASALLATLAATDPDAPVWSWTTDHTAGFWARRQAHELAIHRVDAEGAVGTSRPITAALAVDGIDEVLDMLPFWGRDLPSGGETVHLHCTDSDGEWLVRLGPDGAAVERAHAKGDVAARGTASDLDLYLWGRVPVAALEVFGDAGLLSAFRAALTR